MIVVNWNTRELLRECLTSLSSHLSTLALEVIVVDNASEDGSAQMVASEFPAARLVCNTRNVGFGTANNQAMRIARGGWLLLLNSDAALVDDSVARLFERVRHREDIGVAHCALRYPDGRVQHSTYRFPSLRGAVLQDLGLHKLLGSRSPEILLGDHWDHDRERDVDWVGGAFMLLPREVFDKTGGFDETLFMYGEDMEWCHRIRQSGWRIRYFPDAMVVHADHASADRLYGSERHTLCLSRELEFQARQGGPVRHWLYVAVRVVGSGLRAAYYAARAWLGGQRSQAYRDMLPHVVSTFRALLSLAVRRPDQLSRAASRPTT